MELIYTAHSKRNFYFRQHISKYVLEKDCIPLNPFMIFEYFMLDTVDRELIRNANNTLVRKADQLWVFGEVSDGVLVEIKLARRLEKPIRYFSITKSRYINEIPENEVEFDDNLSIEDLVSA